MGRRRRKDGKPNMSKGDRDARSRTCARYLREAGSIPAAQRLAKSQGFAANTSAWITALGRIFAGKH